MLRLPIKLCLVQVIFCPGCSHILGGDTLPWGFRPVGISFLGCNYVFLGAGVSLTFEEVQFTAKFFSLKSSVEHSVRHCAFYSSAVSSSEGGCGSREMPSGFVWQIGHSVSLSFRQEKQFGHHFIFIYQTSRFFILSLYHGTLILSSVF